MTISRGNFLAVIGLITGLKLLPECVLNGKVVFAFLTEPVHFLKYDLKKGKMVYAVNAR